MTSIETVTSSFSTPDELTTQMTYLVDASGGDVTITLSASIQDGQKITIKKIDATLNDVLVVTANGRTIDGNDELNVGLQYNSLQLVNHLGSWHIV